MMYDYKLEIPHVVVDAEKYKGPVEVNQSHLSLLSKLPPMFPNEEEVHRTVTVRLDETGSVAGYLVRDQVSVFGSMHDRGSKAYSIEEVEEMLRKV